MVARGPLKILLQNFPEQADDFLERSPPPRDGPGKLLIRHVEIASSFGRIRERCDFLPLRRYNR